jgi:hypothetical protein
VERLDVTQRGKQTYPLVMLMTLRGQAAFRAKVRGR